MRQRIAQLWQQRRLTLLAFVLAAALTLLFLVRTVVFTVYWANPAHQNQQIEPWMTAGYVANSWNLPREVMAGLLELEPGSSRSLTMGELAAARGISMQELTARIEAAARARRPATSPDASE